MADVHIMVDCETFGTLPGSALRSIGAVTFDPHGNEQQEQSFYCNIDRTSCEAAGLKIDPDTEHWWNQPERLEAQAALLHDPWDLRYAAFHFEAWWLSQQATHLWCNGACFDEPIIRVAFAAVDRKIPWKYWNVRDTHTIWDIAGVNPKNVSREGVAHNALADARHQARCVTLAYQRLGLRSPAVDWRYAARVFSIETTTLTDAV
jgi:hypothetical protein